MQEQMINNDECLALTCVHLIHKQMQDASIMESPEDECLTLTCVNLIHKQM